MECHAKKNEHFSHLLLFAFIKVLRPPKFLIFFRVISTNEELKIMLKVGKKLYTTMKIT